MGLVHTIPQTDVTVPTFLVGAPNGELPDDWLRSPELSTWLSRKLFVPVSYAMQAMHLAAAEDEVLLRTTGRYRTYDQQVTLFRSRYKPGIESDTGHGFKLWDSDDDGTRERWYLQTHPVTGRPYAMAATPGTSNHGLGLADDIAEQDDLDVELESIDDVTLQWLKDHAGDFGFALDVHSERWHWHWHNGDALTQRTVDVLDEAGIAIADLARFGFSVPSTTPEPEPIPEPPPPTPGDDEVTDDDIERIADAVYQKIWKSPMVDPPTGRTVTVQQVLGFARHAAANADKQTKPAPAPAPEA